MITKKRFIIYTVITMFILSAILKNPFIAGIITLILSMAFYIFSFRKFNKIRLDLLEEKCDPIAFLQETEKIQKAIGEKSKDTMLLEIDRAVGLLLIGEPEKSKEILLNIKDIIPSRNIIRTIYSINLITVYNQLGEIELANELYVKGKNKFCLNEYTKIAIKSLEGEVNLALKNYDESKRIFNDILTRNNKLTKRIRLSILYNLAQIDEVEGNMDSAMEKYKEVAENGNKLYIAQSSREKLVK
ncbi:MAG: hypothetical protein N2594_07335 [Clostridiales bacterium]|nr:hypothetical protein [Clostridiales bacterium]